MRTLAMVAVLLAGGVAAAQPMMVNPAQMSGIPRPDPQVPPGTITVRLIRGELSNRVVGQDVVLEDASGQEQTQKTDAEGRATFSGLSGGPYKAKAKDAEGTALESQPIELTSASGVRVMLVFPLGAGTPDGQGHPDKTLPAGVVVVKAQDGDGKPLAGLDVVLGQVRAGEQQVREHQAKTNAEGEARFEGLDAKPTSGYLAEVRKDGSRYAGKPFRMSENLGARVVMEVRPVTRDLKTLSIGPGSHFVVEINDDAVQVNEVWRLQNSGTEAIDVPGGIHIPLPEKALSAQAGPGLPPSFSVSGHEAVWRGPLPPGDTELQIAFLLAYEGDRLEVRQATPVPFSDVNVVTEKLDGFSIEGQSVRAEERELQGRTLILYRGQGSPAGGEIELTLTGLPHQSATARYLAALMSLLVLGGLIGYGWSARSSDGGDRKQLEADRDRLLAELAALVGKGELEGKRAKKAEELKDKLARLYKELDEAA